MSDHLTANSTESSKKLAAQASLLIVEDDLVLSGRLMQAMDAKGYKVSAVTSLAEASAHLVGDLPAFAVVDMRLGDGNGLDFMKELKSKAPDCRAIMLTGYGSISTAVSAIGVGAFDFLTKPSDADEIHNALQATRHDRLSVPYSPLSGEQVRREHIAAVFEEYGRNVSETARRLGMHRRTLQRILTKVPRN